MTCIFPEHEVEFDITPKIPENVSIEINASLNKGNAVENNEKANESKMLYVLLKNQ